MRSENTKWLHPSSLVFDALSHIRSYLLPFLMALFGFAQDSEFWQYLALFIFLTSLARTAIHYLTLRYKISEGDLIISQGIVFKRLRTIPIRKVQNVDLIQNVLHRLFGVAEVRIETASGTEAEAILRVLSLKEVEELRGNLYRGSTTKNNSLALATATATITATDLDQTGEVPTTNVAAPIDQPQELLRIPTKWLIQAGLSSNRGMLIIGIVIGALFQFDDSWYQTKWFWKMAEEYMHSWVAIAVAIVTALVVFRLFSILWFVMRFYDYQLHRHGEDLRISSGLLTRVSATVPRQRIQFVSVHRSLVLRWLGFATIKIETAGGASQEGKGVTVSSRSWFVPVASIDDLPRLISEIRPGLDWNQANVTWRPVAGATQRRLTRLAIVASILIGAAGAVISWPWGGTVGLMLLPVLIWWARRKSRAMSYARTPFGVAYRSGIFTKKMSMTFFERIQAVSSTQSPFDRRWKMATLRVDTAAAGPADHLIAVPYLDEEFAFREFSELRKLVAQHRFVWN